MPRAARPSAPDSAADNAPDIAVIRQRRDFLAANRGRRYATPGFVLLVHRRAQDHEAAETAIRFGITVSKKVGNAVTRNRMKRRFRELLREALPDAGMPGWDHILIGRRDGIERSFAELREELATGLAHIARKQGEKRDRAA